MAKPADAAHRSAPAAGDSDALLSELLHLSSQLPADETHHVWVEARKKYTDTARQREYVRDELKKLIAKHKAEGTLPKPNASPPDSK